MKRIGWLLGAGLHLAGCSSTSTPSTGNVPDTGVGGRDGSAGTTTGSSCTGSPVVWKEDGTTHCASTAEAILGSNTTLNPFDGGPVVETSLEVVVEQNDTRDTFSFIVTSSLPLGGTYDCTPGPTSVVELTYEDLGLFSTSVVSCSVSVTLTPTDAGTFVTTGTFSAQLTVSDGGTKILSDGTFDLPVTTESQSARRIVSP
jgi:hypothetical protein